MTQPAFLLKTQHRQAREREVVQVDKLAPRHPQIQKETGRRDVGGLIFIETEFTGRFEKNAVVFFARNWQWKVELTAEVKKWVRRLRPTEAEKLEALDNQIRATEAHLKSLKQERREFLKEAFERGYMVTATELRAAAEAGTPLQETVEVS